MKKQYNKPQITTKSFSDKPHVYCTVNKVNGKVYVGATNGNDLNYIGSGTAFKGAVEKYGRENFVKAVLCEFYDVKDAFAKEAEIVTEEFIKSKDNYNMIKGGIGGTWTEAAREASIEANRRNKTGFFDPEVQTKGRAAANEYHRENGFQNCIAAGKAAQPILKELEKCAFYNKELQRQSAESAWKALREDGYSKSEAKKQKTCPHCNKSGNAMAMSRWHFDRCKHNSTNQWTP
jgi:hypothetical protein